MNIVMKLLEERMKFLKDRVKINEEVIKRNKIWKEENLNELSQIEIAIDVLGKLK